MTDKDYDPSSPERELSKETLEKAYERLCQTLVLKGEIDDDPADYYPSPPENVRPYTFNTTVPGQIAKEIFHGDDEELIPTNTASISYSTRHRIEDPNEYPEQTDSEGIYLTMNMRCAGSDEAVTSSYWMSKMDGELKATVLTERTRDARLIEDYELPMTADDLEKMLQIGEYIAAES